MLRFTKPSEVWNISYHFRSELAVYSNTCLPSMNLRRANIRICDRCLSEGQIINKQSIKSAVVVMLTFHLFSISP